MKKNRDILCWYTQSLCPCADGSCQDEAVCVDMLVSSVREQVPTEMEESLSLENCKTQLHKVLNMLI